MFGLLLYLSSTKLIGNYLLLLLALFLFEKKRKINNNFFFYVIIIFICLVCMNRIFGITSNKKIFFENNIKKFIPYQVFYLISFYIASEMKEKEMRILKYFICLEIIIAVIEYFFGIKSLFPIEKIPTSEKLFYYKNVSGLSNGISALSQKVLILFLIKIWEWKNRVMKINLKSFIEIILIPIGILVSFNRTVLSVIIISIIILSICNFTLYLTRPYVKFRIKIFFLCFGIFLLFFIVFAIYHNYIAEKIIYQFTRGFNKIELSGREVIWGEAIEFLKNNFLFGNYSYPMRFQYYSGYIHTHNSFLQLLVDNGFIVSVIFILFILRGINLNNVIYLFPIFLYSFFQYGIFWGISLLDVLMYFFLINGSAEKKLNL